MDTPRPDTWDQQRLQGRQRQVSDLIGTHFASLDALSGSFTDPSGQLDWLRPRPIADVIRELVSPVGWTRRGRPATTVDAGGHPSRSRARLISTLVALESLRANSDVDFSKLVHEEFVMTVGARTAHLELGPDGLDPLNPLTIARLLSAIEFSREWIKKRADEHKVELKPGEEHAIQRKGYEVAATVAQRRREHRTTDDAVQAEVCGHEVLTAARAQALRGAAAQCLEALRDVEANDERTQQETIARLGRRLGRYTRLRTELAPLHRHDPAEPTPAERAAAQATELAEAKLAQAIEVLSEPAMGGQRLDGAGLTRLGEAIAGIGDATEPYEESRSDRITSAWTTAAFLSGFLWAALEDSFLHDLPMRSAGPASAATVMAPHPYVQHRCLSVVAELEAGDFFGFLSKYRAFDRIHGRRWLDRSHREMLEQVMFALAGDTRFDPFELGYSFLIQRQRNATNVGEPTLRHVLDTLLSQADDLGQWAAKNRAYLSSTSGDAYCISTELWTDLLLTVGANWPKGRVSGLGSHLHQLNAALSCIESSKIALQPRSRGQVAFGWGSGQRSGFAGAGTSDKVIEGWSTFETFKFLHALDDHLSGLINAEGVERYNRTRSTVVSDTRALDWVSGDFTWSGNRSSLRALGHALASGLQSRGRSGPHYYSLSERAGRKDIPRSVLLPGPPGTGKTSFVKSFAKLLGWELIYISPAQFGAEGVEGIPRRLEAVFNDLGAFRDVIVFFDEIDGLAATREGGRDYIQMLWTTMLLPYFQDLHDDAQVVYFAAANHPDSIDPAIRRAGRFDSSVLMLPPSVDAKLWDLHSKIRSADEPKQQAVLRALVRLVAESSSLDAGVTIPINSVSSHGGATNSKLDVSPAVALQWATPAEMGNLIRTIQRRAIDNRAPEPAEIVRSELANLSVTRYEQFSDPEVVNSATHLEKNLIDALGNLRPEQGGPLGLVPPARVTFPDQPWGDSDEKSSS